MLDEATATTPQATLDALNRVFMDRYHSLAEYILEASPYVAPENQRLVQRIQAVADFDRQESEHIARLIEPLGGVPRVGPYPRRLAVLNSLSIHYLCGFLADCLLGQIAAYTALLPSVSKCPEARDAIISITAALHDLAGTLKMQ